MSAYSENEQVSRHDIDLLDSIDKYIQSLPQKSRAKESRDIVSSFVLYIEGINPEEHLSWQRNKLIDLYNKAEQLNNIEVLIHSLKEIVDFRVDFWNEKNVVKQLEELPERDEVLVYLDYFRQLNSTLLIPIVTRIYNLYYFKNKKSFVKQIKALMHFVVLWRLSHPNTASIDKVFKNLMLGNNTRSALCVGLGPKNKILDEEGVINFLSNELRIKKINTFDLWSNKFKGNSIYTVSKPTARLAILACYHHSEIMIDQVTISKTKAKLSDQNDLLNITSWKSNRYKTLEHIAPQNMKNTNDWDQDIYSDGEAFSNSLGNLTLLPEAENTAIGNNTWHVKKDYLKCFTAINKDEIDINISKLKLNGLSVKKSTIDIMYGNYALGLPVLSLLNIDVWDKNIIQNRQLNFAKLIWCQACVYLNLQNIEN
ncbi:HNH endonuclease [Shewanella sp. SG44-6]|uniref:HNH endonuclease family protein n=1 Tax=Shewanella sp. SG44-6 TaxID=2760959 RepID=UPI0016045394|nr:HNH endonuclease family protein [Shewanella sp. SG44-6]MBB1390600.1 HNH endonuclease [Shewanella sp. SG44-6]